MGSGFRFIFHVHIQNNLEPKMKSLLFLLSLLFFGCDTLTIEELSEEVKQNMIEHFSENDDVMDVKIVDFSLVHKGGGMNIKELLN